MFSKKLQTDLKKSAQKINDTKKDPVTRYKHLRNLLEHIDGKEAKAFFEGSYSNIFHIFQENFLIVVTNLKQKELPFNLVHKTHKEELEGILFLFEKILMLCPENLSNKWQYGNITRVMLKILHPMNSWKLRREAIKYFILWYQVLGDNASDDIHAVFATLVPGFSSPFDNNQGLASSLSNPIFINDMGFVEVSPIYPPTSAEKPPEDQMKYFLDALLEFIYTQVTKIKWNDVWNDKPTQCFTFLFEKFKKYYLPIIFKDYSDQTNVYKPVLKLPELRSARKTDKYITCRVSVIKWVANFTYDTTRYKEVTNVKNQSVPQDYGSSHSPLAQPRSITSQDDNNSLLSSLSSMDNSLSSFQIVRDVLYGSRENVNFVHEIYRQGFLLDFSQSPAIRRTIAVYKDWIQMNVSELPPFMLEPVENFDQPSCNLLSNDDSQSKTLKLRSNSYSGAMNKDNTFIRAGLQNVIQLFITHAANVFLLESEIDQAVLLEEQVDTCKRVLNLYRYMVMHTHMETTTWEQLLIVLLQITSTILGKGPPAKKKEETLGGKLAQAIFQTLIVTWIKANLNVVISSKLWDQFLEVLSSLTQWEELIREWAKTMETLTRVLARHVYNLDLHDLPLDRMTEQKSKRRRGVISSNKKNETSKIDADTNRSQISIPLGDGSLEGGKDKQERLECMTGLPNVSYMTKSLSDTNIYGSYKSNLEKDLSSVDSNLHSIKPDKPRRWHSLDSIRKYDNINSRSSSPVPSSSVEINNIKEAQIQIDVLSSGHSNTTLGGSGSGEGRSVMAGGNIRGWTPDVAVVLWKRMLGALGDVNCISDSYLHAQVYHHLIELSATLIRIRQNQGVSIDNQSTPPQPTLTPPITIFAPWCFQSLKLPDCYQRGKLSAYKLLCQTTIAAPDQCLSSQHITCFYTVLHQGLTSQDKNVVYTIMRHTGPRFFSRRLPGYTILIPDFVKAAHTILSSDDLGLTPRAEAVAVLSSLLSFPKLIEILPSFNKTENFVFDLKNQIVKQLINSGRKEPNGLARCIAFSGLGMFLYQEFSSNTRHSLVKEAFNTLLLALKFNNEIVAQVACDVISTLCDHAKSLTKLYPELPPRTIEVLASALASMTPIDGNKKRLISSLIFSLAEWTMNVPTEILLHQRSSNTCLLLSVFKVLNDLTSKSGEKGQNIGGHFNSELVKEFVPDIILDNLKENVYDQGLSECAASPTRLISTTHSLQLAANMVTAHLVNHLGQFPLTSGAERLSSLVTESDDLSNMPSDQQLTKDIFSLPNIQMFVSKNNLIMSLIELEALESPGGGITAGLVTAPTQVRLLLRSLNGKYCWDASVLYCTPEQLRYDENEADMLRNQCNKSQVEDVPFSSYVVNSPPQNTTRKRPPHVLPTFENSAPDLDNLDDLLQYIGHTSPECLQSPDTPLNIPASSSPISPEIENDTISTILGQRCMENEYVQHAVMLPGVPVRRPTYKPRQSIFQQCRLLFSQLGFTGWQHRSSLCLLEKNEKVIRELRNLDSQFCRETHKMAVIYVSDGQEDKMSILSNRGGSQAYEDFIAGLAWEVELETHTGFMGGLQRNKTTGITAPYYATSFMEVIFHVATRMPSLTEETFIHKTRHLGNDEVHIVWSEHNRDYRRDIIPTEFCDILIVIYPLPHRLYRIQISKKPEVPYFGPLFNEAIVEWCSLAGLVRATAINASRAKRSMLPFYQQFYEERYRSLETVVRNHSSANTFEEFVAQVYSPTIDYSVKLRDRKVSEEMMESSQGKHTSMPLSIDVRDAGCSSWSTDTESSQGISPRPFKKLTSKGTVKKSLGPVFTPPESPSSRKSK